MTDFPAAYATTALAASVAWEAASEGSLPWLALAARQARDAARGARAMPAAWLTEGAVREVARHAAYALLDLRGAADLAIARCASNAVWPLLDAIEALQPAARATATARVRANA